MQRFRRLGDVHTGISSVLKRYFSGSATVNDNSGVFNRLADFDDWFIADTISRAKDKGIVNKMCKGLLSGKDRKKRKNNGNDFCTTPSGFDFFCVVQIYGIDKTVCDIADSGIWLHGGNDRFKSVAALKCARMQ